MIEFNRDERLTQSHQELIRIRSRVLKINLVVVDWSYRLIVTC